MSILFEPMRIKNMELRNRFVRSATGDRCAGRAGHVSDKQVDLFAALADGGVGLIVTGITNVYRHSGHVIPFQSSIASDDCIPGFERLTAAVHDRGAKIALQLYDPGREGVRFFKGTDVQAMAPSFVDNDPYFTGEHRSMTEDEVWDMIRAFGDGAKRAREAEFDAVQLHGAHGYLLSQFLSPHTNRRTDEWGGAI